MKDKRNNIKRGGKRKVSGWIIALLIIAVLGTAGGIGWSFLAKEHDEARNLPLNAVNFANLNDGIYIGEYVGGMYKWRANKVQVTVSAGKVSDIEFLSASFPVKDEAPLNSLYDRVIKKQSLQVDVISGATLTTKGYLQAVENALIQAQR